MTMTNTPTILTPEEIDKKLKNLPAWRFEQIPPAGGKISKEFKFKDFIDSLKFVNDLAPFFESLDHHPDIQIKYNKVFFELQRFDIGGKVTDLDFTVASEIERKYGER